MTRSAKSKTVLVRLIPIDPAALNVLHDPRTGY